MSVAVVVREMIAVFCARLRQATGLLRTFNLRKSRENRHFYGANADSYAACVLLSSLFACRRFFFSRFPCNLAGDNSRRRTVITTHPAIRITIHPKTAYKLKHFQMKRVQM